MRKIQLSIRKARKGAFAAGFRSVFELKVNTWMKEEGINVPYEPCKLDYTVPASNHKYTPDWKVGNIVYEGKGYFAASDRKKMLHIIESNPDLIIRMLFQNAQAKINKRSKTSYADWCDKFEIEWCDFRDKEKLLGWLKPKGRKKKV
jgi:hypothetical protein